VWPLRRVAQLGDAAATAAALRGDVEGRKEREVELLAVRRPALPHATASLPMRHASRWQRPVTRMHRPTFAAACVPHPPPQELGRTMGALDATQEQVVELRWERERCRTR
jgi:hypothetical protein